MITLEQTNSFAAVLNGLRSGANADLKLLLAETAGLDPMVARRVLSTAFPEIFDPYMLLASDVSAEFYDEMRVAAGVKKAYAVQSLTEPVPLGRWSALAGWGSQPSMMEQGAAALLSAYSGAISRMVTTASADTIVGNAQQDSALVGYQRVPSRGCCAFCGLLASKGVMGGGDLKVIGRGTPVGKHRLARGIRPRGSRQIGQDFHDDCRCSSVPVFENNRVQMQEDADQYYDSYRDSSDKVNDGYVVEHKRVTLDDGTVENVSGWVKSGGGRVSSEQNTKNILAGMRFGMGVK